MRFLTLCFLLMAPLTFSGQAKDIPFATFEFDVKHNPGRLFVITTDGRRIEHTLITLSGGGSLNKGDQLIAAIDEVRGAGLRRISDGAFYKVHFSEGDPFETEWEACFQLAVSNVETADCAKQRWGRWEHEYEIRVKLARERLVKLEYSNEVLDSYDQLDKGFREWVAVNYEHQIELWDFNGGTISEILIPHTLMKLYRLQASMLIDF